MTAIVNAVWDLHAKRERKPVWKLLADMTPRQVVDPVVMRRGRYLAPAAPGYSSEIKAASRAEYRYPDGRVWKEILAK
jgi:L-fuconate dehydratase